MGDAMNATHRTVDPNVRNLRDQACLWFIVFFVGTCTVTRGNDWPEFRGPTGQGIAADTPVALEWNEEKNITWKTQIPGLGWSSPVIANDKVWLTTFSATNNGSLRLLGFSTTTGESIADVEVFRIGDTEPPNPKNSLASPTPAIDPSGTRIYVHFGAYGTAALTTTGEILWTIRLPYISQHGNGGSRSYTTTWCSLMSMDMTLHLSWRSTRQPEMNAGEQLGRNRFLRRTLLRM